MANMQLNQSREQSVRANQEVNGLRAALLCGTRQLIGVFVTVPRIEVVEIAALAGFDVIVLDCEHGAFGVESLPALIAAGQGCGAAVIVRVPENRAQTIGAALDAGADGILVPHIDSGTAATLAAQACRFPPTGERSVHNWVRAAKYGVSENYTSDADSKVAVLVMAEGPQAVTNLSEMLAVPEIDGLFIGPMDLAAALGLNGLASHPQVREIVNEALSRASAAGKAGAVFAPTPDAARVSLEAGARLVVLSVDTDLMTQGFAASLQELRADSIARATTGSGWQTGADLA